jgi:hypothetical protein
VNSEDALLISAPDPVFALMIDDFPLIICSASAFIRVYLRLLRRSASCGKRQM